MVGKMRLKSLRITRYKSVRTLTFNVGQINLLIGSNASGKSNILDALRFLSEGLRDKDFAAAVYSRGGIIQLAWKGEEAREFELVTEFEDKTQALRWQVRVIRKGARDFFLEEALHSLEPGRPPTQLLYAREGTGSWYSEGGRNVQLTLPTGPTGCALEAAAADDSFPGRAVVNFIKQWGFFDPSPGYLRQATFPSEEGARLDTFGHNIAGRLYQINEKHPQVFDRIVNAVRSLVGVPDKIEPRISDDGSVYFVQSEWGFPFTVHQKGVSAGTLRILALMTALLGEAEASLVGIEEPENYVHPHALSAFSEFVRDASGRVQIILTTHSPLLLNFLGTPEAVCVVRGGRQGTELEREGNPDAVRKALDESGFGLGDFYETKGFGR
jgi:predicted ATPase